MSLCVTQMTEIELFSLSLSVSLVLNALLCPTRLPTCVGTFSISVTGYLLHTSGRWSAVFSMMAVVNLLGMMAFLCCGSSKKIPLES